MIHNRTIYILPDELLPKSYGNRLPKSTSTNSSQLLLPNALKLNASRKSSTNGSYNDDGKNEPKKEEKVEEKPQNFCQRLMGGCVDKMPCCATLPCFKSKVMDEAKKVDHKIDLKKIEAKVEDRVKSKTDGIFNKLNCFKKEESNEDAQTERLSSVDVESGVPDQKPQSKLARFFACCFCCRRQNKVNDKTEISRSDGRREGFCSRLNCCKSKQKREEAWAMRRDSILSQSGPTSSCGKFCASLFCCMGCSSCCRRSVPEVASASRRPSMFSKNKSMSPTLPPEDTRQKLDVSLVEHTSHMRGAIPVLPVPAAWVCLVCNVILPGLGTILSGVLCLCLGIPRFGVHDGPKPRLGAFVIDAFVGVAQLFTVLFCLVGWGWSIWWGTIMLKVAKKYRKLKEAEKAEAEREQPQPVVAANNNHVAPPAST